MFGDGEHWGAWLILGAAIIALVVSVRFLEAAARAGWFS